ncbi:MAG: hypothetical protein V8R40_00735 [Dysosmobacter sp.]
MNTITLDFSGIKSYWELHEYLKEIFRLPDYLHYEQAGKAVCFGGNSGQIGRYAALIQYILKQKTGRL